MLLPRKQLYYFVSDNSKLEGTIIQPRVPENWMTLNNYEDSTTKRISVSKTIDGALSGLSSNLKGTRLYVYCLVNPDQNYIYEPDLKQVPDSGITGELWYLSSIRLKLMYPIEVIRAVGSGIKYTYGNNKIAYLYNWLWKISK